MRDMADATPDSQFEIIANAAHLANLENTAQFTQVICAFLNATP